MLRCLSPFNSGVPVKPDQHGIGEQFLHGSVEFAGLRAVAFVNEDEKFSPRLEAVG